MSSGSVLSARRLALSVGLIVSAAVVVSAQTLPSGWTVSDVGSPAIPGYGTYSNQTFTVSGAGAKGIGATSDQFTLAHQSLTGDGIIIARVASLQNAPPNAQVGIMLRDSLDARSKFVAFLLSKTNELMFKRRTSLGGSTANTKAGPRTAPVWLKLQRQATTITASWSNDGSTWTVYGSAAAAMGSVVYAGLAVTSYTDVAAAQAAFTNVQITSAAQTGGPLPNGWASEDVGAPGKAGSATYSDGTFAVTGGGTDIAGTWDEFHYAYITADDDVDIIARLRAIGSEGAKAGLMVRDGLTPNGAHASMFYIDSQGTAFQRRPTPGGSTVTTSWTAGAAPIWLKLAVRSGVVTGYRSNDGVTWTSAGTQTLTLPSPFYIGLAVSSRNDSTTVITNIDNVRVQVVTPSPNQYPSVSLTAPAGGATYTAPATVTITAAASDGDGTVSRVDFYAGATLLGSDASSPYSIAWSNVPAGTYSLTAVATDDDNGSTTSAARTITVNGPANTPPTVSLTGPANGATFTAPATVTVSANASDSNGTIARVDFYQGATLIGTDTISPYSVTWSNVGAGSYTLTARATDNAGATTTSAGRTITVSGFPTGWTAADVGSPAIAGSTTYSNGAFTIRAGGEDIWGMSDEFRYVYRAISGDFDVVARVLSLEEAHPWSKAGIMIRATLAADAANAAMLIAASKPRVFQRRTVTGGTTTATSVSGAGPSWVKLARRGTTITASISPDGTTWTVTGTQTMTLPASFYVGVAVSSVNASVATTAVVDNVTVAATTGNVSPTVSLTAPANAATFTAPATIAISANAADSDGTVARVDFYQGSTLVGSDTTAPYSVTWSNVAAGTYTLSARATDDDGAVSTSAARTITVNAPANQPPTVSLTAPANGATFTAPATFVISANAADSDGTVARVDFYRGSTLVASDATAPYSVTWSNVAAGSYTLTARATDDDGAVITSAGRSITVNAPANQPPTVSLTAPANASTYTAPASITVSANASDTDGTVVRVDFYQGSTLIGSDTSSPFSVTWSNVGAGTYTLTARATDEDGATMTSASRSVTVAAASTKRNAVFTASPDHATLVTSYLFEVFAAGVNPATSTPIASQNLGKPAVVGGEITADVTATINALAAGTYQATVSAVGSGGSSRGGAATFTK